MEYKTVKQQATNTYENKRQASKQKYQLYKNNTKKNQKCIFKIYIKLYIKIYVQYLGE
jgi:hypothetical protein